jgi:hypothetical protein
MPNTSDSTQQSKKQKRIYQLVSILHAVIMILVFYSGLTVLQIVHDEFQGAEYAAYND